MKRGDRKMKTVFSYLKPYLGRMGIGFTVKVAGTVSELLLPYILSFILADVITRSTADIVLWGGLMIVCSALACILNITANRMASKVSKNFAERLRKDLFLSTLHLSAAQTDEFTIPSLESRITTDTYNIHGFVNMMQRLGVRAPILLIGGIAITLFMDAHLALVMIAMLPLVFGVVFFVRMKGIPLYTKVQKSTDGMVSVVREDMQGIRVIKALSKTGYEHRRYSGVNKALSDDEVRAGLIMSSINPLMNIFMNLGSVAVIALGGMYITRGESKPETIIAFMQYFTQISMALMSVTRMFVMYTKCAASANRIEEVLIAKEDIPVLSKEEYPDIVTDAHIKFDHVDFSVRKGEHIGIIGATGSGKSTVIKLLLRFYEPNKGGIYINGENIRTVEKERLYAMFGSVLQQDFLYAETIEENIRFGRELSDEAVKRAAGIAQADAFIGDFDDGYAHELSPHGTNISGGQKQRVLISRALAAEPDILILDDSSSALDYKTDAALRRELGENLCKTTVITVAQRVSSVKNCDLILVMDHGRIIGMGRHENLLETCCEYREISESQMGGAFVD